MPSFTSGGTVFGRWTNRRTGSSTNVNITSPSDLTLDRHPAASAYHYNGPADGPDADPRGPSQLQSSHRRDSSILSLTTSNLTEIGANVKRSVSLRSHRTNPSSGGSSTFGGVEGKATRSPTSRTNLSPLSASSSPTEGLEEVANFSPTRQKEKELGGSTTSPRKDAVPPLRRKISLSAKGFSQKFARSTDALPTLNSAIYLENVAGRSPTAGDPVISSPMLVSQGSHAAPSTRKMTGTSESSRPSGLHPPESYSRSISSSHGDPNGAPLSRAPTAPTTLGGPLSQKAIYTQIQETSTKRIATIDYLRKMHEGDMFYFGTIHYTTASLSSMPSLYPHKLARRATNYFLLGYSLPVVLDMTGGNPLEYLKALSSLLAEFETYQNLSGFDASGNTLSRGRMGAMFKSGMGLNRGAKGRRSSTSVDQLSLDPRQADALGAAGGGRSPLDASSPVDLSSPINPTGHEFTYLLTPHLPFDPDFKTTLGTLCDTLVDTYAKIMNLVGSPDTCSTNVGTEFAKADKAIRKILVANVVKEFEDTTRNHVKGEMAGLGKLVLGGLA